MASIIEYNLPPLPGGSVVRQRPDPCADECTPACPACGGLKCLCRPRFFCGQLLTDEDLTSLEQYVIDKNRLHNRYLVGWGVACGLEVACDPCDSRGVVVRPGYALSPCGDDIVVCRDTAVDICALIDTCHGGEVACEDTGARAPRDCRQGKNDWVLAICYDERPSRGITAQFGAGDTACGPSCSCGGRGSGGCGCGGGSKTAGGRGCGSKNGGSKSGAKACGCGGHGASGSTAASPKRKTAKPECEPTRVCETYRFVAYPAPEAPEDLEVPPDVLRSPDRLILWMYANRSRFGPLIERVLCCALRALDLRASVREGKALDANFAQTAYVDFAAALKDFASDFAVHNCAFVTRLDQMHLDATNWANDLEGRAFNAQARRQLVQRLVNLDNVWLELVSQCLCSALLPACPAPARDNCVPLAVVHLAPGTCRVTSICNWEARKLLITWPTVMYWLSWLPLGNLKKWVAALCCEPDRGILAYYVLQLMLGFSLSQTTGAAGAGAGAGAGAMAGIGAILPKAAKARIRRSDSMVKGMDADNLFSFMAQDFDRLAAGGSADDPGWAVLAARLGTFAPEQVRDVAAPLDVGDLARRLDDAEARLRDQHEQIVTLKKKVK